MAVSTENLNAASATLSNLSSFHSRASDNGEYLRVTQDQQGYVQIGVERKSVRWIKGLLSGGVYALLQERKLAKVVGQITKRQIADETANGGFNPLSLPGRTSYLPGRASQVVTVKEFAQAVKDKTFHVNIKKAFESAKKIANGSESQASAGALQSRVAGGLSAESSHSNGTGPIRSGGLILNTSNSNSKAKSLDAWVNSAINTEERSSREATAARVNRVLDLYVNGALDNDDGDADRRLVAQYIKNNFQAEILDLDAVAPGETDLEIRALPSVFEYLPNLKELTIGVKTAIRNINDVRSETLQSLVIRNSFLQKLPDNLDSRLPALSNLNVSDNLIVGITASQKWPSGITTLNLKNNSFVEEYRDNIPQRNINGDVISVTEPRIAYYEKDDLSSWDGLHYPVIDQHSHAQRIIPDHDIFFSDRNLLLLGRGGEGSSVIKSEPTVTVRGVEIPQSLLRPHEDGLDGLPLKPGSSLEEALEFWYSEAGKNVPEGLAARLGEPIPNRADSVTFDIGALIEGLSRLSGSQEYVDGGAGRKNLASRIINVVEQARDNPIVKEEIFEQCGLFSATCHDGVAEALLNLENSAAVLKHIGPEGLIVDGSEKNAEKNIGLKLKAALKQSALIEAARQYVAREADRIDSKRKSLAEAQGEPSYKKVDRVEYELSYLTELKKRGDLSIGPSGYLYTAEGVDSKRAGIAAIKKEVKNNLRGLLHDSARKLAKSNGWQSAVVKLSPGTKAKLEEVDRAADEDDVFEDITFGVKASIGRTEYAKVLPYLESGISSARKNPDESEDEFTQRVIEAGNALASLRVAFNQGVDSIKPVDTDLSALYKAYSWAIDAKKEEIIADATVEWAAS